MNRFAKAILILLPLAGSAAAQDKVIFVADRPVADVERSFGLTSGTGATGNWALLQPQVDSSSAYHSYYFPGKVWAFTKTMAATGGGRRFVGNGLHYSDRGDAFGAYVTNPSRLAWAGGTVLFDGTTKRATTSGISPTITVIGHTVAAEDALHTIEITAGTNFTPGIYHIVTVSTGANTYTLDRNCSTGAGSGMVGSKKGTLWRDVGFGNVYEGLNFRGTAAAFNGTPTPTDRAAVLWQQTGALRGKAVIRDCTFANADVAMLFGKGLAAFDPDSDTSTLTPAQDYDGKSDDQADHNVVDNVHLAGVRYGIVIRATQSIAHDMRNIVSHASAAHGRETIIYAERGGKFKAEGIYLTNGFVNGPTVLRIGGAGGSTAGTVEGPMTLNQIVLDAPSPDLRLVEMDGLGNPDFVVEMSNVQINSTQTGTNRTFNGSTLTATTSEASRTITISGSSTFIPAQADTCLVLTITGGTNFIPGYYTVKSISGQTWTLDRVCTTGAGSAMTGGTANGFYRGPIVTISDGANLVLENVRWLTPGCLKIIDEGATWKGTITLRNCGIWLNATYKHEPQVVVDDSTTVGRPFVFENCYVYGGDKCRDGTWVMGAYPTGGPDSVVGWEKPNVYDLDDRVEALEP